MEQYFQTDIDLTYNISFLMFLKFRKNNFEETAVAGSNLILFHVNTKILRMASFDIIMVFSLLTLN